MIEPVRHHFVGDLYFREMDLPSGMMAATHKHNYDHASIVLKGSGWLYWGTESQEYKQGDILHIVAGVEHRFVAQRNTRILCVHHVEEPVEDFDALSLVRG